MNTGMSQADIGDSRIIQRIELSHGKGAITADGRPFFIHYTDLLDVVQAVEAVMMKTSRKLLNRKFVPKLTNRAALKLTKLECGDADLYDGLIGENPTTPDHFYLLVEIGETRWDTWFTRLDELIKALYKIVEEAQSEAVVLH
jgi:hypothetical protein